jgi:CubicO group peptidase (beta-lactamase class C family)
MFRARPLALVALLTAAHLAAAQTSLDARARFAARADSLAKAYLAESHSSGASIAVVRGRDTLVMAGVGIADKAAHRPATATTIYRIGSITKQFTAAAIMRLVEEQRLRLDDDLSTYVPDFPYQGRHVTIRRLLNHTSGIHNYTDVPAWQARWAEDMSPESIVSLVRDRPFDFQPGTAWSYSNTGYVLLGMVIEKVTHRPYAEYLRDVFFRPLGMQSTSYCPSHPTDPAFAAGYGPSGADAAYLSMTQPFSAGALCSTVGDLVRWQRALAGGRVVNPASYAQMITPDTLIDGHRLDYGFGLAPGAFFNHRFVGHDGGINGFQSSALYFPDDTLSVVVLVNNGGASPSPNTLALNLVRLAYGMQPAPTMPPAVPLDDATRDRVAGSYELRLPNGGVLPLRVFVDRQRLMAQAQGQPANPLVYLGNNVFGIPADPTIRITFFFGPGGKPTKLTLLQGGVTLDGPRVP